MKMTNKRRKNNKNSNRMIILLVLLFVGIISLYFFYLKPIFKKQHSITIHKIVKQDETINYEKNIRDEIEHYFFENLSKDGYGFIKVSYNDHSDIVQLIKNGKNRVIVSVNTSLYDDVWDEPYHLLTLDNKFYFGIEYGERFDINTGWQNESTRMFSINLKSLESKELVNSLSFILTFDEYAVSDNYIFYPRTQNIFMDEIYKIFRFNINTLEETVINNELDCDELLFNNNRLYLKCDNKYYVMDENGNNLTTLKKDKYKEIKKSSKFDVEGFNSDSDMYFLYKNNKVYVKNNKLYYKDKVIYTPKKNRKIELMYTDKYGYVGIVDYKENELSQGDEKFYIINLDTKKISKSDDVYYFNQVLY